MRASSLLVLFLASAVSSLALGSATGTLTNGGNLNFGTAASGDPSPDAVNDTTGVLCCSNQISLQMLNNAAWGNSSSSYAASSLSEAQGSTYNTGNWIPSDYTNFGSVYYIRTGTTPNFKWFKLRTNGTNTASGLPLFWDYLGFGIPQPPVSNFSFNSYDLITNFTDTSTGGTPTTWSWTFGDAGTSTSQSPRHRYASAGTRSACLTASNSGGGGGNTCKNVAVSLVTSTTVAVNGSFNLDGDGLNDMQVLGPGCSPIVNQLHMLNTAKYMTLSKDYRNVTAADIGGGPTSSGDFCVNIDYLEPFLVKSTSGAIYKAWTADNSASGIRLEFALLQAAPPPPPVSNYTFATYDLIVQFTDTSTGSPNSWSWTFGDGGTSSFQGPTYRYASAGMRSACLTASNSGGAGNNACKSVTVSLQPSTTVATGSGIDLEADGKADLLVGASGGCPVPNKLTPANNAKVGLLSKDYRNVTGTDASGATYGSYAGGFCVNVNYLEPFVVLSSFGSMYRAWTAANDAGSVRLEYSLLVSQERIFANGFD